MIYVSSNKKSHRAYNVAEESGRIILTDINGVVMENPEQLISSMGGREKFLSLCTEGDLAEAIAAKKERLNREREQAAARNAEWEERKAQKNREACDFVEAALKSGEAIVTNLENIEKVLRYLNSINWGHWDLPKMTIGYRCNQYDCGGKTATAIILDEPVGGSMRYVFGAPVGHLDGYTKIG